MASALISQVGIGRLLYGSDYCATPERLVGVNAAALLAGPAAR